MSRSRGCTPVARSERFVGLLRKKIRWGLTHHSLHELRGQHRKGHSDRTQKVVQPVVFSGGGQGGMANLKTPKSRQGIKIAIGLQGGKKPVR